MRRYSLYIIVAFLAGLSPLTILPASAQPKMASIFSVANVKTQAESNDSVDAKKKATLKAEMRALEILLSRVTDFKAQSKLPDASEQDVEQLVSDIDVRSEGVSGTSYSAVFGINFSERAFRNYLQQNSISLITDRGPEILIVSVYLEDGAAKITDKNPWRMALGQLDLAHALVPAKIAPVRGDITAAIARAYLASPASALETLKQQYRTDHIMLAVLERDDSDNYNLKVAGIDTLGNFDVQRKIPLRDGQDDGALQNAAQIAFNAVQERWKLTRSGSGGVTVTATPTPNGITEPSFNTTSEPTDTSTISADFLPVQITAQFSGLKEWQTIRAKMQKVPGVQNWDLKSVNPRSAVISFDFPGGTERYIELAHDQGIAIENSEDGWIAKYQ